jgi:DNA mismatch endonuclease (patch repair protein)
MADRLSPEARSRLMARIKLRGTGPEMLLRRALWATGLRYRLKLKVPLPGKSDIIFPGPKLAVFVDGCFWHGCPLHGHLPKTREGYWEPKLARIRKRDTEANAKLQTMGWRVLRFWEHQVREKLAWCAGKVGAAVAKAQATQSSDMPSTSSTNGNSGNSP